MVPDSQSAELPPVLTTIAEVRAAVAAARSQGRSIGLVATMGALHAGHLSLVDAAKKNGDHAVVSIYVNPTQFGPKEDLAAYPRTLDADQAACAAAGVDLIFAPSDAEMYPPGDQTRVHPGPLANALCGPLRPGHFEGVCTVVAKLLSMVQPDVAYFGQKDYQQSVVIRRMVVDLCIPVRLEVCPIVREADGLAMSSRNAYLSADQRGQAVGLYRALCGGRDALLAGERDVGRIEAAMSDVARGGDADVTVDYLRVVDPESLTPAVLPARRVLVAGAVRLGSTRLIDNLVVDLPPASA